MYMAFKMAGMETAPDWHDRNPGDQWWDQFVANLSNEMMEEVCHAVLDYYTASSKVENATGAAASSASRGEQITGASVRQ
jgi:N-glycosylase/DNA lyase